MSEPSTPQTPSSPDRSESKPASPAKRGRWLPGWPVWGLLALAAAGLTLAQLRGPEFAEAVPEAGSAIVSIISAVMVFLATATVLVWLGVRSSYPWWLKAGVVAGVLSIPFLVKVEHSGDLFSTHWHWRWRAPDQALALPKVNSSSEASRDSSADPAADPQAFLQYLGSGRDGRVRAEDLEWDWNAHPPSQLWKHEIGAGWSGFVVAEGLAITQEQRGEHELVTAYEIETGAPVWFHSEEGIRHADELGGVGPRATPTIAGDRVFAQGATGILVCLDFATGDLIWRRDVVADVGSTPEQDLAAITWGRAGSPLVLDELVVVPGGGANSDTPSDSSCSLIAYDRATGDIVWRGGKQQISYASPTLMVLDDQPQIVSVNESTVSGHDPVTGQELWSHEWPGRSNANASTSQPVQIDTHRVLLTKGYGIGAELIEVQRDDADAWSATSIWKKSNILRTKLTSAVLHGDAVFGLNDGLLECVEVAQGDRQWKQGRVGHGQILLVDSHLIVLSEQGRLYSVPAEPTKPDLGDGIEALEGITWNTIGLYGNRLLVRNAREAACFELPQRVDPSVAAVAEPPGDSR